MLKEKDPSRERHEFEPGWGKPPPPEILSMIPRAPGFPPPPPSAN